MGILSSVQVLSFRVWFLLNHQAQTGCLLLPSTFAAPHKSTSNQLSDIRTKIKSSSSTANVPSSPKDLEVSISKQGRPMISHSSSSRLRWRSWMLKAHIRLMKGTGLWMNNIPSLRLSALISRTTLKSYTRCTLSSGASATWAAISPTHPYRIVSQTSNAYPPLRHPPSPHSPESKLSPRAGSKSLCATPPSCRTSPPSSPSTAPHCRRSKRSLTSPLASSSENKSPSLSSSARKPTNTRTANTSPASARSASAPHCKRWHIPAAKISKTARHSPRRNSNFWPRFGLRCPRCRSANRSLSLAARRMWRVGHQAARATWWAGVIRCS